MTGNGIPLIQILVVDLVDPILVQILVDHHFKILAANERKCHRAKMCIFYPKINFDTKRNNRMRFTQPSHQSD